MRSILSQVVENTYMEEREQRAQDSFKRTTSSLMWTTLFTRVDATDTNRDGLTTNPGIPLPLMELLLETDCSSRDLEGKSW